MYRPYTIDGWRGLDLRADAAEAGWNTAIDGLNFDIAQDGRLTRRPGLTSFSTAIPSGRSLSTMRTFGSRVVACADSSATNYTVMLGSTGSTLLTTNDYSQDVASCGPEGYIYTASTARSLRRIDPTSNTYSAVLAGSPGASVLATTPRSDRLAAAGLVESAGILGGRVRFSAAGDGATWGTNDYVRLDPGDGEDVNALCAWDDYLFAFKPSKFFVFTGESLGANGNPIFNYRAVKMGKGCAWPKAAVATPNGVFFVARDGIYVTTGGAPTCVSDAIAPLFTVNGLTWAQASTYDPTAGATIGYNNGRVYVGLAAFGTLVYDLRTQQWLYWKFAASSAGFFTTGPDGYLLLGDGLGIRSLRGTTDAGTAFTTTYTSGSDRMSADTAKTIREIDVRGSGSFNVTVMEDGVGGTARAFALGSPVTFARAKSRATFRAERPSVKIDATGAFALRELTARIREARLPGVRT